MKNKDLLHAMTNIDDSYIESAKPEGKKKHAAGRHFIGIGIAAACLCITVGAVVLAGRKFLNSDRQPDVPNSSGPTPTGNADTDDSSGQNGLIPTEGAGDSPSAALDGYAVVQAEYPERIPYPKMEEYSGDWDSYHAAQAKWREDQSDRVSQSRDCAENMFSFYAKTMQELLVSDKHENRAYSPLNLYMALSMLAELTDGNSRAQILELLDADGTDVLRRHASVLWDANYADDGTVTSLLANSLWLNQHIRFVPDTMATLSDTWHASSYQGEMGSEEFTQALQSWLNEQTGGLLTEQVGNIRLEPQTVLALASTIYYRAQWAGKFDKDKTAEGIFHAAAGDIPCDFMHKQDIQNYYWNDNFSAISRRLENSGAMWLFLPDEGVSVNELAAGGEILQLLQNSDAWGNQTFAAVNISMPKFDIVSEHNLAEELPRLGITDILDPKLSDFSPMTRDLDGIFLSHATHAARISADEEGCIAAAFTQIAMNGGGMAPADEVDFTLDRPFLFVITGADGNLLFAGVVEQP